MGECQPTASRLTGSTPTGCSSDSRGWATFDRGEGMQNEELAKSVLGLNSIGVMIEPAKPSRVNHVPRRFPDPDQRAFHITVATTTSYFASTESSVGGWRCGRRLKFREFDGNGRPGDERLSFLVHRFELNTGDRNQGWTHKIGQGFARNLRAVGEGNGPDHKWHAKGHVFIAAHPKPRTDPLYAIGGFRPFGQILASTITALNAVSSSHLVGRLTDARREELHQQRVR